MNGTIGKDIIFEDVFITSFDDLITTSVFFIVPIEWLNNKYTDSIGAELCIEFPADKCIANECSVTISPTREIETDCFEDYDWSDYDMSEEDITLLLEYFNREWK